MLFDILESMETIAFISLLNALAENLSSDMKVHESGEGEKTYQLTFIQHYTFAYDMLSRVAIFSLLS